MTKIIGNPTVTPMAVPDWNQPDSTKADFIKNKPYVLTEEEIIELIAKHGGGSATGKVVQSIAYYDTTLDGQIGIYVWYTDGTTDQIWIPGLKGEDGKDGEDGVGIERIYATIDDSGNSTVVFIELTNGESKSFEIPNGYSGEDGEDGVGISSINTIEYLDRTEITINLTNGQSTTLNVYNGYSPVRGIDYWTEEDKAEIKSYVDEAILGGAW